jgi:hypothetical protein
MKTIAAWIFVSICLSANICNAQTVSLSYPVNNCVIQRNTLNKATATIAGQLIHNNLAVTLSYRVRTVSAAGVVGAAGPATNLSLAANGMFYTTLVVNKGWYLCEILFNGVVYASAKFGIGDVFIIAGQSNAQGTGDINYPLPGSAGVPEWIIGTSEDKTCAKDIPFAFTSLFSLNTADQAKRHGRLGPSGNGIWAYAILGKLISDANGGMPVAFFNAASGGTTITQWKQGVDGVEAKHPYTQAQICLGHNEGGSLIPSDYYGLPYTTLKNALNVFGSLFGVRAILWHQGEADADLSIHPSYQAASPADYQNKLQAVIAKSRADFGANLLWYISKASISKYGPLSPTIRTGQGNVVTGLPNLSGPDTDYVTGSSGATTDIFGANRYRIDSTHFYEGSGAIKGLTWLANKWYSVIGALTNPIAASWVPQLTYLKVDADWRTLTAPSGGVSYIWNTLNANYPAVPGGSASVFTTADKYIGIKCHIKDPLGNWHISPAINVGKYANQREGVDIAEDKAYEDPGFELNAYPNPYTDGFTVSFEVPDDNSHVRLEIMDSQGQILKTIVNNPHTKGKWEYAVKELAGATGEVLFCRLKVGENHTVKKLVQVKK